MYDETGEVFFTPEAGDAVGAYRKHIVSAGALDLCLSFDHRHPNLLLVLLNFAVSRDCATSTLASRGRTSNNTTTSACRNLA